MGRVKDGKSQRWEESEMGREEKRREEKKKEKVSEDRRSKRAKRRKRKSQKKEDPGAQKGRKVAKDGVFPMICGSEK